MAEPITSFSGVWRWLSNFFPAKVEFGGDTYPTVEHAYQAAKTYDDEARKKIRDTPMPGRAKAIGRTIEMRPDWEALKEEVMLSLLRQKFSDRDLSGLLVATGDTELIEGNYWGDTYWGVCRGEGKNRLGVLLMQVREERRNAR